MVGAFATPRRKSANRKIRASSENRARMNSGSGVYHRPAKGSKKTTLAKSRTGPDHSSRTKNRTAYKNKSYSSHGRR